MTDNSFQDILSLVEKPSRHLGSEINTIKKDSLGIDLRVALAFPDLYDIGTSHFGLQILYNILNKNRNIAAERVFAPGVDMATRLKSAEIPLMSLETHTPLSNFDIIGFSLLYELNYTNILFMLDLAKIPFFSSERDLSFPLVIAGGPCTCNPEPVAELFDAMVIGDGERVIMHMCRVYLEWKDGHQKEKEHLLNAWSKIEGVYIPSFFKTLIGPAGFQTISPKHTGYQKVTRAIVSDFDHTVFPASPVIPYGKPVHDRLRIEIARGCTRGCRFCQAGMIYRPVRERSLKKLLKLSENSLSGTGYEELSLLSLSSGDYSGIVPLMEHLTDQSRAHPTAISLPSVRAETLTSRLMKVIKSIRKTGFTIAPEAGSQRLRDIINKNISEKDIFDAVRNALMLGWQGIKLYFMVGLPMETDGDLHGIVDLVKKLRKIKGNNRGHYRITVSVATFIPKPHTPFQWASQVSLKESKEKIYWLKAHLKMPGIHFKWQNPEVSILEGLWARGDRRLSRLLTNSYKRGCRFDGWSDQFQFDLWEKALSETDVDINFFTTRTRSFEEPLPWEHIDTKVRKTFLQNEWEKAIEGSPTPDCRWGDCSMCGVCDFKKIAPEVYDPINTESFDPISAKNNDRPEYRRLKLTYSKKNQAKYLSHLELVNIMVRAIRRAGILVKYSEGFHPKPKISFEDPLPIGIEGLNEVVYLTVHQTVNPQQVLIGLNAHLPEGLFIKACDDSLSKDMAKQVNYMVTLKNGHFNENALECFINAEKFCITQVNQKGKIRKINLKALVSNIEMQAPDRLKISIPPNREKTIRPVDVLHHVLGLGEDLIKTAGVVKL